MSKSVVCSKRMGAEGGFVLMVVALLAALLASGPAEAQPPCGSPPCGGAPVPAMATVTVDCAAGESVQQALETPAVELTVEIRGICHEDVVVERDDVTLSGRSPALDGLRGVSPDPRSLNAVLRITSSERVRVENLSIADGARNGIQVDHSSVLVDIVGCEITDTGRDGIQASLGATSVRVTDSTVTDHGRSALAAFNADFLECVRCDLRTDAFTVLSVVGSRVIVTDSTVEGGIFAVNAAEGGALVALNNSTVVSDAWSMGAQAGEVLVSAGTTFEGSMLAFNQGLITLNGAVQTANAQGFNVVEVDSMLSAVGSSIRGFTLVKELSGLALRDGSSLNGDLVCELAGDAWCADASVDVTGTASCEHCATPAPAAAASVIRRGPAPAGPTLPAIPVFEP